MLKWLKNHLKRYIQVVINSELQKMVENTLPAEIDKLFFKTKWAEFKSDSSTNMRKHILQNGLIINLYKENYLSYLIFSNQFEKDVANFIENTLKSGHCFVDIGANIGFFTLIASPIVTNNGLVLSFEPTQDTYQKLCENIKVNQLENVNNYQIALSNYIGESAFYTSTNGNDVFNGFSVPNGYPYTTQQSFVNMLDSYYDKLLPYKNKILIKIDIEGWEYLAIEGAHKVLSNLNPIVIIEFNDEHTTATKYKCKDVYNLITSYGYTFYSLHDNNLVPKSREDYFSYQNLIAKKELNYI